MSLLAAVTPGEAPQTGVKRPLQGKPTNVPNNLPAFRGREVAPGGNVKAPKLSQGNRPNEGTNIPIPYNRVCPLEFLSGWTGRLAPGDVAFVMKHPPGFLKTLPNANNNATAGTATMSRVIGLDGVNRLLHGSSNPDGWRVGLNVLYVNDPAVPFANRPSGPMDIKVVVERNDARTFHEKFRLDALEDARLDGVVKSNDEPYSFTSNGARDAVVFNNVIQGPTLVNNGYLVYDPKANPTYMMDGTFGQTHGAQPLRTVEAYPRGSIEGGYHLGGGVNPGRPGVVGSQSWMGHGQYDFVAAFSGTYTTYPGQMFDRMVQPMNSLYLGLRAYEMSLELKMIITKDDGSPLFPATTAGRTAAAAARCYFYQYMPFASRKAWLCQHVQDEILKGLAQNPPVAAQSTIDRINNTLVNHNKGAKKSRFDDDIFDAVRTEDLANMVGAWHVGRVLDIKSQRHTAYDGGPSDTGFSLMVDVQIGWRKAVAEGGGSADLATQRADAALVSYASRPTNEATKQPVPRTTAEQQILRRRAIDQHNAQFPSLQATLGGLFGSSLQTGFSLYSQPEVRNGEVNPNYYIARTIGVRWPTLNRAWEILTETAALADGIESYFVDSAANMQIIYVNGPNVRYMLSELGVGTIGISLAALVDLFTRALNPNPPPEDAVLKELPEVVRSLGLAAPLYNFASTLNQAASTRFVVAVRTLFRPLLGPLEDGTGTPIAPGARSLVTREAFFYAFAGLRVKDNIRKDWFQYGPSMFPTLSEVGDQGLQAFSMERLEEIGTLAGRSEWNTTGHLFVLPSSKPATVQSEKPVAELAELAELAASSDAGSGSGSGSGVHVGATAESSLASSWASLGEEPAPTAMAVDPTPVPVSAAAPTEPEVVVAPAPAPTARQTAATAAAARSAPITAAAMATAAAGKKRAGGGGKSPARTRGAATAATPAATGAAAEAAAAPASQVPPPGAASATSAPLLPTLAPPPAAPTSASASAGVDGLASVPGGLANPPAPAAAARRRDRGGGGAAAGSGSTVASVFDSIFGAGLEQAAAGAAPDTGAGFGGSPPASPTPSSGSEQGSGAGPKTFRRGGAGAGAGGSGRPR